MGKGAYHVWQFECNCSLPGKLIGRGTIRRCGFVGVGGALLEEVCHCGGGL